MNKRRRLTRFLGSLDFGLAWHFRIVATLPEDHRPFWGQKLKQKAGALAKQERKVASLSADRVGKRHLWRLQKELASCYADLIEHCRSVDARSATRLLRVMAFRTGRGDLNWSKDVLRWVVLVDCLPCRQD